MKFSISADCQVGCIRENNEDMILVGDTYLRNDKMVSTIDFGQQQRYVIAVADGMGGHKSGEVASRDMLENLHYFFNDLPNGLMSGEFNETLQVWLMSINSMMESKGIVDPAYKEMGTTLVALFYYGGDFYWVNCGDSRLYLFHDGQLDLITTDHSLNVLLGESKHSNVITNCIGGGCKTSYLDIVKCTELIRPGSILMLCSDGLTDMVDDQALQTLIAHGSSATDICKAAIHAGGYDNVSACVINVQ